MISERYTVGKFVEALRNPRMFLDEARRLCHRQASRQYFRYRYGEGTNPMDGDWDNLFILDACRYDIFQETNTVAGDLESRVSNGSTSIEFLRNNFSGRTYHDTVYVTANPKIEQLEEGIFYSVTKTYSDIDQQHQGRTPEHVCDAALEAHEKYPDKRLVIHFMQPHSPYIGSRAEQIRERIQRENDVEFFKINQIKERDAEGKRQLGSLLNAAKPDYIDDDDLRTAYVENLKIVLDAIANLLDHLNGKSVITADHGEMLGNTSSVVLPHQYGHRPNAYLPELRLVPWLVLEAQSRRTIRAEEPIGSDAVDEEVVEENLRALGYVD